MQGGYQMKKLGNDNDLSQGAPLQKRMTNQKLSSLGASKVTGQSGMKPIGIEKNAKGTGPALNRHPNKPEGQKNRAYKLG
jgi:hypothetical protein